MIPVIDSPESIPASTELNYINIAGKAQRLHLHAFIDQQEKKRNSDDQ